MKYILHNDWVTVINRRDSEMAIYSRGPTLHLSTCISRMRLYSYISGLDVRKISSSVKPSLSVSLKAMAFSRVVKPLWRFGRVGVTTSTSLSSSSNGSARTRFPRVAVEEAAAGDESSTEGAAGEDVTDDWADVKDPTFDVAGEEVDVREG